MKKGGKWRERRKRERKEEKKVGGHDGSIQPGGI